ncbi:MAG: S8 family peptidase, partial [Ideonella sp.]
MRRFRSLALRGLPAIAVATGALASSAFAAGATPGLAQAGKATGSNTYIVQLSALPVATNPSTAAPEGGKLDSSSPAVQAYMASLAAQQNAVMASAGVTKKLYSYGYTFNGFAAEMTAQQAAMLSKTAGVLSVDQSAIAQLDTSTTPAFLGLTGPNGFYAQTGAKGENVIIGMVDSGVWTNHPSFAGAGYGAPPPKWKGICQTGVGFTAADCNNKLIGARFYNVGPGGNAGVSSLFPQEFNSPKDADGHGTHTASTAGGNEGVSTAGSVAAAFGTINGIAPRARVAIYKACWGTTGQTGAGCYTPDTVAAIDQAVADGVDVINYSISGTQSNVSDPVEVAFRNAAAAGVFVAVSAGNDGPANFKVAHPSPWTTTVAAATHNRATTGTVTLGNAAVYTGASVAISAVPAGTAMILSSSAIRAGHTLNDANLCYSSLDPGGNALDPALVAGKIVVCDRGTNARVNKSLAVKEAGGVGMVLINASAAADDKVADFHSLPTVHLALSDRTPVRTYVAAPTPTGAISKGIISLTNPAPAIASFSSRGPIPSNANNVNMFIKPDISAPGVDILAGSSPIGNTNASIFALLSGTSMSSPHIAGIAALMKQARPGWSPMAIKSALMTTAGEVLDGSRDNIGVLAMHGAGFVNPSAALNPGLVFDSGPSDWNSYLCGQALISQPSCLFFS